MLLACEFIASRRQEYRVAPICRALGVVGMQIAPRTYRAHLARPPSKRALWDAADRRDAGRLLRAGRARPPAPGVPVRGDEDVGVPQPGRHWRHPTVITAEIIRAARDMLPNPDASVTAIVRLLGVSPGTLHNHIPDLQELRAVGRRATTPPSTKS